MSFVSEIWHYFTLQYILINPIIATQADWNTSPIHFRKPDYTELSTRILFEMIFSELVIEYAIISIEW